MKILIICAGVAVWIMATIAIYRTVGRNSGSDEPFADFICGLVFWPIILLAYAVAMGWQVGRTHAAQIVTWSRERKQPKSLRAGMDNGLYD